jgi:hypothetical protein
MIPIVIPIHPGQSSDGLAKSSILGSRFDGAKTASPAASKKYMPIPLKNPATASRFIS